MDQGRAWRQEGQLLQGEGFRRDWRSGPLVREQEDALQGVAGAARSLLEEAPLLSESNFSQHTFLKLFQFADEGSRPLAPRRLAPTVCSQNASALATRSAEDHAIMSKSVPLCGDTCDTYHDES